MGRYLQDVFIFKQRKECYAWKQTTLQIGEVKGFQSPNSAAVQRLNILYPIPIRIQVARMARYRRLMVPKLRKLSADFNSRLPCRIKLPGNGIYSLLHSVVGSPSKCQGHYFQGPHDRDYIMSRFFILVVIVTCRQF